MESVKIGVFAEGNKLYTPLEDNLELIKERNKLIEENIELRKRIKLIEKTTGTLEDIKEIVGYKDPTTIDNKLLLKFRNELDYSRSKNGCIVYPPKKGQRYSVNLLKFKEWYLSNFNRVHG